MTESPSGSHRFPPLTRGTFFGKGAKNVILSEVKNLCSGGIRRSSLRPLLKGNERFAFYGTCRKAVMSFDNDTGIALPPFKRRWHTQCDGGFLSVGNDPRVVPGRGVTLCARRSCLPLEEGGTK